MKNIHLIPTDKPSLGKYLVFNKEGNLCIWETNTMGSQRRLLRQNIYITSDEEIKEGDWGFDGLHIFKCLKPFIANETTSGKNIPCFYIELDGKSNTFHETSYIKKIILTTDQDLIKDGVQAIDDEFLEWFVKNPSCEKVSIEKDEFYSKKAFIEGKNAITNEYKIIIPKEEHKITNCGNKNCQSGVINGKNPKLCKKCNPTEEPKPKTLEEFIKVELEGYDQIDFSTYEGFIKLGAKWQQERMYSEAIDLFITEIKTEFKDDNWDYLEFIKERVIEQFKKK